MDRTAPLQQLAPRLACAVLAVGIAVRLLWLIHDFGSNASAVTAQANQPGQRVAVTRDAALILQQIVQAHLFGSAPSAGDSSVAEALSELTLRGTLAAADPGAGQAIIELADKKPHLFAARQRIDANGRLLRVFNDRVVIEWNGRERVLAFAKVPLNLGAAGAAIAELVTPESTDEDAASASPTTTVRYANSVPLLESMNYRPRMVGTEIRGFQVDSFKDENLAKLGLQEGDVVTAANGESINSKARLQELFRSLASGTSITATVMRDGEVTTTVLSSQ
jgi:general secretion pathway protein C